MQGKAALAPNVNYAFVAKGVCHFTPIGATAVSASDRALVEMCSSSD